MLHDFCLQDHRLAPLPSGAALSEAIWVDLADLVEASGRALGLSDGACADRRFGGGDLGLFQVEGLAAAGVAAALRLLADGFRSARLPRGVR